MAEANLDLNTQSLLLGALDRKRLGHALLLISRFENSEPFRAEVFGFVKALLCLDRKESVACGRCASCALFHNAAKPEELSHPDALYLKPEAESYTVQQIRTMSASCSLRKSLSERRVIWLSQAERLAGAQGGAGNALLKILEEPFADTIFILTTGAADSVMDTLRSRCHSYRWQGPSKTKALAHAQWPDGWNEFKEWLFNGARGAQRFSCPPDQEKFWSDRKVAVDELRVVYGLAWHLMGDRWNSLPGLDSSRRVLAVFQRFDELLVALNQHGQPALHWLKFQSSVRIN